MVYDIGTQYHRFADLQPVGSLDDIEYKSDGKFIGRLSHTDVGHSLVQVAWHRNMGRNRARIDLDLLTSEGHHVDATALFMGVDSISDYRIFLKFLQGLHETDKSVVGIRKTELSRYNMLYMVVCNDLYFLRGTEKGDHISKLSSDIVSNLGLEISESDSP